jgi:phosphomannomutase
VGIALVLQFMTETGKSISELVAALPHYFMIKEKIACPKTMSYKILDTIQETIHDGDLNKEDGLRIGWPDGWVHLRASNTEPIIRVIAEGKTRERARGLVDQFKAIVEKLVGANPK